MSDDVALPCASLFEPPSRDKPLRLYDSTKLRSWVAAAFALETLRDDPSALAALRKEVARTTGFPQPDAAWAEIAALDVPGIVRRVLADSHEGEAARDRLPAAIDRDRFDEARRARIRETALRMERDGLVAYGWGEPAEGGLPDPPSAGHVDSSDASPPRAIRGGIEI